MLPVALNLLIIVVIDVLEPPTRNIAAPLRFPISNVFKGQGSTVGVAGRISGGVVQVGERVRILPGDETAVVKGLQRQTILPDHHADKLLYSH